MATIADVIAQARQFQQAGNLSAAEHLCRQILQADTSQPEALHLLGVISSQMGRPDQAVQYFSGALQRQPLNGHWLAHLGYALQQAGRPAEAVEKYREALRLEPDFPEAHGFLGGALVSLGLAQEAEIHFSEAVRLRPDSAFARCDLGSALLTQRRFDEAVAAYQQAARLQPNMPEAPYHLGLALQELGRLDEALDSYRRAVRLKPDFVLALNQLGAALNVRGRPHEAVTFLREAVRLQPDLGDAYTNLGNALAALGQLDEALVIYREAVRLQPGVALAHCNLGSELAGRGELNDALACFREALRLQPDNAIARSNWLFCLNYRPDMDNATLLAEHQRWDELHGQPLATHTLHLNPRDPERRLRVGYVSPDFKAHAVARFLEPILTHHDPKNVEVFCYSDVRAPDAVTARLQALGHGWRTTVGLTDIQIVDLIRQDHIDALVDLSGHTAGNRLGVFANKPAPVQVTYLGYPNTTGLKVMDYRLTDAIADPPGEPSHFTEQLVRLPGSFGCYRPPDDAPEVGPLPADRKWQIVFGSLHGLAKLNSRVLDLWSTLLQKVPEARLLLFRDALTESNQQRLRREFAERGIGGERIAMRGGRSVGQEHLLVYQEIDISLDPFPWNGHTTACESLWMGVPVVTLRGSRHSARMVASLLTCLNLNDWIAETPEQYVELAAAKAKYRDSLRTLRSQLRERMRTSPLLDGQRFTRALEDAYREMWRRWCSKAE